MTVQIVMNWLMTLWLIICAVAGQAAWFRLTFGWSLAACVITAAPVVVVLLLCLLANSLKWWHR